MLNEFKIRLCKPQIITENQLRFLCKVSVLTEKVKLNLERNTFICVKKN